MPRREVRALIIQPDGESAAASVEPELDALQAAIGGGYLECVTLPDCHLYCDEEGKLKGLPMNSYATALARRLGWQPRDVLCGPVIGSVKEDTHEYRTIQGHHAGL